MPPPRVPAAILPIPEIRSLVLSSADERLTPFATAVLAVVAATRRGDLLTYGDVAREAGRPGAARAVGSILRQHGRDVPWWRVVPASGRLAEHLRVEQARCLRQDGVVVEDGRIQSGRGRQGGG